MKKIIRLTENDLVRLVKRVIKEQTQDGKIYLKVKNGTCKINNTPMTTTSSAYELKPTDVVTVENNSIVTLRYGNQFKEISTPKKYMYSEILKLFPNTQKISFSQNFYQVLTDPPNTKKIQGGGAVR